jgi:hypothetical protein
MARTISPAQSMGTLGLHFGQTGLEALQYRVGLFLDGRQFGDRHLGAGQGVGDSPRGRYPEKNDS